MDIQTSKVLMALLAVCFLDTLVLAYIILRSRWAGWRLITTIFFVFYGVMTFIAQIESLVFHILPPGVLPRSSLPLLSHCWLFLFWVREKRMPQRSMSQIHVCLCLQKNGLGNWR